MNSFSFLFSHVGVNYDIEENQSRFSDTGLLKENGPYTWKL